MALPDGVSLRRTWPQRLLLLFNCVLVVSCFGAAAALAYADTKVDRLQRVSLDHVLAPRAAAADGEVGEAQNILLVGVDSVEGLDPDDPRMQGRDDGLRSDTIMVLRLDPALGRAALLSLPRDLWLPLGGDGSFDKINAAMPIGGPDLLIETVSENFDIEINHYVQVNFAQFQSLVDVVGGVPVPFDRPMRDTWTGLDVAEPRCVVLEGQQALDYVRSRHLEVYEDGYWSEDPASDLSRIRRQQDFIKRALKRAVNKGLRNPITMNRLIDVGLGSVTVDSGFGVDGIVSLANRFRSFDPDKLETYPLPVYVDETSGGASIVRPIEREARAVLDIFRGRTAGADDPGGVVVDVYDGTDRLATTRAAQRDLAAAGFEVGEVRQTGADYEFTTLLYRSEHLADAELVARWIAGDVQLEENDDLDTDGVVLILGQDFRSVRSEPAPTEPDTEVTDATDGADTVSADGSGEDAEPATTTTGYGIVPGEGAPVDLCAR